MAGRYLKEVGGTIRVTSERDVGTTFLVTLPCSTVTEEEQLELSTRRLYVSFRFCLCVCVFSAFFFAFLSQSSLFSQYKVRIGPSELRGTNSKDW